MKNSSLTFQTDFRNTEFESSLESYTDKLRSVCEDAEYSSPESSLRLPYDSEPIQKHIESVADAIGARPKVCIVVGIGGSSNGTQAVYNALRQYTPPEAELIFVDTVSPAVLEPALEAIEGAEKPEDVLINVVSKSGTTTETISNFEVLYDALKSRFSQANKQVVATTNYGSPLWYKADKRGMHTLTLPDNVGGRFSVLSPVGLFPLAAAGYDTKELLAGAKDILDESLSDASENLPAQAASAIESARRDNDVAENSFLFNPELRSFGEWYRQLVGESLGKEYNRDGEEVHAGILPLTSIGTTDLHSVGQLYFGGPRNIFTTFIRARYTESESVPQPTEMELIEGVAGKSIGDIMDATYQGVIQSYQEEGLPLAQIELSEVNEYALGQLLQFKMLQVMYQGELMNINAFNQPNVEGYKDNTRSILTS